MSTFLELCQTLRQESGVAGTGPAAVTAQTGMYAKLVNWTMRAWNDIQAQSRYWKFRRVTLPLTLTAGVYDYAYTAIGGDISGALGQWNVHDLWIYEDSEADKTKLTFVPYTEFRLRFPSVSVQTAGRPQYMTETTEAGVLGLRFNCPPAEAYVCQLNYYARPQVLSSNNDTPLMPDQFHDAIVWRALMMYAGSEGVPELFQYAKSQYNPMLTALKIDQAEAPGERAHFPLARGRSRDTVGFSNEGR